MENATKALYMAAGVLVGILILTVMIFVFRQGGQLLETLDDNNKTLAIEKFNSELIIYNREGIRTPENESYNTIFDIVTACNLAWDINEQNLHDVENCLEIEVTGIYELDRNNIATPAGTSLNDLIRTYGKYEENAITHEYEYEHIFSGTVEYNMNTGKINKIIFTEV